MRKFREGADRHQVALFPRTIDEYVPEDDIVRFVDALIDELDLSGIESKYSSLGRPAYSPRVLVKILLYGKMRGIRSSRELERASQENLRFIFLANDEKPDFRTIIRFRSAHHRELASLLQQTIAISIQEQLITLDHISIDGTKIRSFAGKKSFRDPQKLHQELVALEAELALSFAEDVRGEEEDEDDDSLSGKLPSELRDKKALRAKIQRALKHYNAIEGEKPKHISLSDPQSRFMRSVGKFPSYNAQLAVDGVHGFAVAGFISDACTDHAQLRPMLEEVEKNTGANPKAAITDKGYGELEALAELKRREIDGYIPQRDERSDRFSLQDFQYHPESDSYTCPNGRILTLAKKQSKKHRHYLSDNCDGCGFKSRCIRGQATRRSLSVSIHADLVREMREKTRTSVGQKMAILRAGTVERAFGHIKYCKKLRQFCFRGMNMINSMWQLELAAFNLEKIARIRYNLAPN